MDLKIPARGLTLLHESQPSKIAGNKSQKLFAQLSITQNTVQDLLRSLQNNEQVRLKTGKKPVIHYGKKSIQLNHGTDASHSEIFSGLSDGSQPVYFSGKLSHTLEAQEAKAVTAKSDEALAALQNSLKSLQEQRVEATLVGDRDKPRKDHKFNALSNDRFRGSTPSSPYLAAGRSPGLGPTSAPLLSPAANKDRIRSEAMRIPIVHLLAARPMTSQALAKLLHVSKDECEKVLEKVSVETTGGKRELKSKSFRDLDVWKFPYTSDEDRKQAIENAIHAYDKSRLDKNDLLWQLLLPKDERGQGKILSRLNFDRPPPAPKPTLEAPTESSDREGKAKKTKSMAIKDSIPVTKKKQGEGQGVRQKLTKTTTKPPARPVKSDGKYKSSERIEDSDEEAEAVPVIPAKQNTAAKTKERGLGISSPKSLLPTSSKSQLHKSKLSESSSVGNTDQEKPQEKAQEKLRVAANQSKLKPQSRSETSTAPSRPSPRPRTDSSPQKPSPLGSSPPTNSTDLENSSKASTQSSAPSSPPSSTDTPIAAARHKYSPVVAGKGRDGERGSVKRKAESSDEQPPAKKQQADTERLNALPKGLVHHLANATSERRSSGSSSSSPEKPRVTKKTVIAAAKDFTAYYTKYKDMHANLSKQSSKTRDDKEIDKLWRMHRRLEEMKAEIWTDWDKISSADRGQSNTT